MLSRSFACVSLLVSLAGCDSTSRTDARAGDAAEAGSNAAEGSGASSPEDEDSNDDDSSDDTRDPAEPEPGTGANDTDASAEPDAISDEAPTGDPGADTCASGQRRCTEQCVDLTTDPDHCGDCGIACAPEERCSAGVCSSAGADDGAPSDADPSAPDAGAPSEDSSNPDQPAVDLPDDGELRAFPGASGFGALASGGRGGRVLHVTTLDASGPGSLQAALSERGPRVIVFEVSGVIEAELLEIEYGDVTIAGQTAPGGGITIKGRLFGAYDDSVGNIILRHVRVRPEYDGSDGAQFDALQLSRNHTIMLDHISVGFGVDENVDLYSARNITVQWSTIESPTPEPSHEGGDHNYGLINGPDGRAISVHHNLFAHSKNRNPAIANGPAEVLNNVMYNVRHGFVHHNPASGSFNLIGNYLKDGPDDTLIPVFFDDENGSAEADLGYYLADNWVEGEDSECEAGPLSNPWLQCEHDLLRDESFRADEPFDFSAEAGYRSTPTTDPASAYETVLARAGAFPRDVVTVASVADARSGGGSWGMALPDDLMQGLEPSTPPPDLDRDGMADDWETARGLDPTDSDDHGEVMDSGYTAIEEYLNELAERLLP